MRFVFTKTTFLPGSLFLVFSLLHCDVPQPVKTEPYIYSISLEVSKELQNLFLPITKNKYNENEIEPMMRQMITAGNRYCRQRWGQIPVNKSITDEFLTVEGKNTLNKGCNRCFESLVAGCNNYFQMNDRRPDKDLLLVRRMFPADGYDCYSVGFIQPYMMHNILQCRNLTMLDIDWRIHDGHHQLLKAFQKYEISDANSLDQMLNRINLAWIARLGRGITSADMSSNTKASLELICGANSALHCRYHLLRFARSKSFIRSVHLSISALHSTPFEPKAADNMKIIFLSNAIEDVYTSRDQFNSMLKNLNSALLPGQKAVLIHHVSINENFGLYEFTASRQAGEIKTICKDIYHNSFFHRKSKYYQTYFDEVTISTENIPTCHSLI